MPHFQYTARDETGRAASGEIVAASRAEAARMLRGSGKFVVRLEEGSTDEGRKKDPVRHGPRRVKQDQVIYFANQLAIMVETGVPLADALQATIEDTPASGFRTIIEDVISQVQAGREFSAALARHPGAFPRYFVNMIKASEASGLMSTMLRRLAEYMIRLQHTRRRILRAMTYPIGMVSFCSLVTVFMLVFLIPRFVTIFQNRGAALPVPTQILLGASDFITGNAMWLVPSLIGAVFGTYFYLRTAGGLMAASWLKIHFPILGKMFRQAYTTSAMRTLGTMIDAGVSMLEAISITRGIVNNHYYQQLFDHVDSQLRKGSLLSDSLKGTALLPATIIQMILAGERAGQIGPVMNQIADFCDRDLENTVHNAIQLIQPTLVVFLGMFVGGTVIALLLPIFSISRVVSGG